MPGSSSPFRAAAGGIVGRLLLALAAVAVALVWLAWHGVPAEPARSDARPPGAAGGRVQLDVEGWVDEAEAVIDRLERELADGRFDDLRRRVVDDAEAVRRELEELAQRAPDRVSRERLDAELEHLAAALDSGSEEAVERLQPIITELRRRLEAIERDDPPVKE